MTASSCTLPHYVYGGEAIAAALPLAIAPYLILRAAVTRLVGKK